MFQQASPAQFSTMIGQVAPYFASIAPQFAELRPGYAEVTFGKRREVLNHIGTVHAIALCNAAELVAGTMTDASIPAGVRWIGLLGDIKVPVMAYVGDTAVLRAEITLYLSKA